MAKYFKGKEAQYAVRCMPDGWCVDVYAKEQKHIVVSSERKALAYIVKNEGIPEEITEDEWKGGITEELINLELNCVVGSPTWFDRVREVMRSNPEDFVFYRDELGNHTLSELIDDFEDKEGVKREVIQNLYFYAKYDVPSMYCILREKGYKTVE